MSAFVKQNIVVAMVIGLFVLIVAYAFIGAEHRDNLHQEQEQHYDEVLAEMQAEYFNEMQHVMGAVLTAAVMSDIERNNHLEHRMTMEALLIELDQENKYLRETVYRTYYEHDNPDELCVDSQLWVFNNTDKDQQLGVGVGWEELGASATIVCFTGLKLKWPEQRPPSGGSVESVETNL